MLLLRIARFCFNPVVLILVAAVLFYLGLGLGLQKSETLAYVVWGIAVFLVVAAIVSIMRRGFVKR